MSRYKIVANILKNMNKATNVTFKFIFIAERFLDQSSLVDFKI